MTPQGDDVIHVQTEFQRSDSLQIVNGVLDSGHNPGVEKVKIPGGKHVFPELEFDPGPSEIFRRFGLVGLLDLFSHDEVVVRVETVGTVDTLSGLLLLLVQVALLVRPEVLVDVAL